MSSAAAKKPDEQQTAEVVELSLSTDREQGLSQNFADPVLEDLIPGLVAPSESSPESVVHETVEAVQELITETQATKATQSAVDLSANFSQPEINLGGEAQEDPAQLFVVESHAEADHGSSARWEMAEKLFQLVACERTFDNVLESALAAIMKGVGAHAGAILELDNENQNYFFRSSIGGGDPEKVKAFRVPFHKGIVGHVGESRQSILLRDLNEDVMQMRAISMSVGFEAVTCMAAPIQVGGQLYGVIEMFNRTDGGFYDQKDLQALEDSVRMLAKVLEVRFLMAELLRRGR